jgi:hypothetical protein
LGARPAFYAPFDSPQERFGRRQIMVGRKQQGDVDGNTGEDSLLDGGQAFLGARNLDKKVRAPARACSSLAAARVLPVSYVLAA